MGIEICYQYQGCGCCSEFNHACLKAQDACLRRRAKREMLINLVVVAVLLIGLAAGLALS